MLLGNGSRKSVTHETPVSKGRTFLPQNRQSNKLTFDDDQHGAVSLTGHVGGVASVQAVVTLLAVQDFEDEVLGLVQIGRASCRESV